MLYVKLSTLGEHVFKQFLEFTFLCGECATAGSCVVRSDCAEGLNPLWFPLAFQLTSVSDSHQVNTLIYINSSIISIPS